VCGCNKNLREGGGIALEGSERKDAVHRKGRTRKPQELPLCWDGQVTYRQLYHAAFLALGCGILAQDRRVSVSFLFSLTANPPSIISANLVCIFAVMLR